MTGEWGILTIDAKEIGVKLLSSLDIFDRVPIFLQLNFVILIVVLAGFPDITFFVLFRFDFIGLETFICVVTDR